MTIRRDQLLTRAFVILFACTGCGIVTRAVRQLLVRANHWESLISLLALIAFSIGLAVFHRRRRSPAELQLDAPAAWVGWGLGWSLLHWTMWWDDIWSVVLFGWLATAAVGGSIAGVRFEPRTRAPIKLFVIAAVIIGLVATVLPAIYTVAALLKGRWIVFIEAAIAGASLVLIWDIVSRRPLVLVVIAAAVLLASGAIGPTTFEIRGGGFAPSGCEWIDRFYVSSYVLLLVFGVSRRIRRSGPRP